MSGNLPSETLTRILPLTPGSPSKSSVSGIRSEREPPKARCASVLTDSWVVTLAYDSDLEMLKTGREHPVMESVLASGLTFLVNDIYHFDSLTGSRLPLVGRAYAGLHHFEEVSATIPTVCFEIG